MKAGLAILITLGMSVGCWLVSALIYFDLTWILVLVTSLWAASDSSKIELYRYKLGISCKPIVLFCLCYLLWVLAFPYYLWARFVIKDGAATIKSETPPNAGRKKQLFHQFSKLGTRVGEWGLVCIVALKIALLLFCIEECWRGQRAWEEYKHGLEARGQRLDWSAMIPPHVPDSQNFFAVQKMSTWFSKHSDITPFTENLSPHLNYTNATTPTVVARVEVASPGTRSGMDQRIILQNDSTSRETARKAIQGVLGSFTIGSQGFAVFVTKAPKTDPTRPLNFVFDSGAAPRVKDLLSFFGNQKSQTAALTIKPDGTNSFLLLASFCLASDYLRWSDQHQPVFTAIQEATKRPYARIGGNYDDPATMPIPNFVNFRAVAQTLARRAQCYLLLGLPDKALHELQLVNNLRRQLEGAPTGKPMPVVTSMINVAIAELFVDTIADGFRLHVWQEAQLVPLQELLAQINLTPLLKESFHHEQLFMLGTLQNVMARFEFRRVPNASVWQKIKNIRPPNIMRGFFYFNILNTFRLDQMACDSIDAEQKTVKTQKVGEFHQQKEALDHLPNWRLFPYEFLAILAVPDWQKAIQNCAFVQTKADEARIVCALEGYRLSQGKYPRTLEDLSPRFAVKLPHDIIGGQALNYRPTSDGSFVLYSLGWNGKDDKGIMCNSTDGEGDWCWQ